MKKVIALVLSVLLLLSVLPTAAFASEKTDEIKAKMEAARDYLYGEKTEFTAAEGYDFLLYLYAGGNGEKFKDAYVQSVKDAFDAGTMNTADRVAIAGLCLEELEVETIPFELNDGTKVDLREKVKELGVAVDSPYNYFFIKFFVGDNDYLEQIENALKADYTAGKGYNYWGFGTDNTANFAAMINDNELKNDAVQVVETAKTDKGYYYLEEYGTYANGNTTASVLFMYAYLMDLDNGNDSTKADEVYKLLMDNFSAENGAYAYEAGGAADNYATRDVLKALIFYYKSVEAAETPSEEQEKTTDDAAQKTTAAAEASDAEKTGKQSTPPTGDSLMACGIAGVAVLALGAALVMRKKEEK